MTVLYVIILPENKVGARGGEGTGIQSFYKN